MLKHLNENNIMESFYERVNQSNDESIKEKNNEKECLMCKVISINEMWIL
jgi:hypothetical protein